MLCTVTEAYQHIKEERSDLKIGKNKFAELLPTHVLIRSETPANLCLCLYHEDMCLMCIFLPTLPNNTSVWIKAIVCDDTACLKQTCKDCRGLSSFQEYLGSKCNWDDKFVKKWNKSPTVAERRWQAHQSYQEGKAGWCVDRDESKDACFKNLKFDLSSGEAIMPVDFSENYTMPSIYNQMELLSILSRNTLSAQ